MTNEKMIVAHTPAVLPEDMKGYRKNDRTENRRTQEHALAWIEMSEGTEEPVLERSGVGGVCAARG